MVEYNKLPRYTSTSKALSSIIPRNVIHGINSFFLKIERLYYKTFDEPPYHIADDMYFVLRLKEKSRLVNGLKLRRWDIRVLDFHSFFHY